MPCRRLVSLVVLSGAFSLVGAVVARAHGDETLDFNRPESWAMKYYASLTLFTGVEAPQLRQPGEVDLALEGGDVPQLNEQQRRVGFDGTKVEDVNKTKVFARLRGSVGLGKGLVLEAGYTPPIRVRGARPNILALALGRPVELSPSWRLGVRAFGQIGTIDADITCSAGEVAAGNDQLRNPFDCVSPSSDRSRQKVVGAELAAGYDGASSLKPYAAVSVNYMNLEFDVNALYSGGLVNDHTIEHTSGTTVSARAGVAYEANRRLSFGAEIFYSPLSIVRPPASAAVNDGLFNVRAFVRYRVR